MARTMLFLIAAVVLASSVNSELSDGKLGDALKLLLAKTLPQDPRCPDMPGSGICLAPTCGALSNGRECPGGQVCCGNGCTMMCVDPKPSPTTTGAAPAAAAFHALTPQNDPACPKRTGMSGICMAPMCGPLAGGRTCAHGQICCGNDCTMMCYDKPKPTTPASTDLPPPVVVVRVSTSYISEGETFTAACGVLGPAKILYYIFRVNNLDYTKSVSSAFRVYEAKKKYHDGVWTCVAVTSGKRGYNSLNNARLTVVGNQSSWSDSFINSFWRALKRGTEKSEASSKKR